MKKKNVEDERFEKLEQDIQAIQRSTDAKFDEIKQLLVKRQWRRRGRSRHPRSREENGEMGESATVKKSIVMRKSEEVEEGWNEEPVYDIYPEVEEESSQERHIEQWNEEIISDLEEKNEKIFSDLKYKHSLEITKSEVTKENEGDPEPEVTKPESEKKSESEKNEGTRNGSMTMAENDLEEIFVSCVTEVRERWEVKEMVRKSDRAVKMLRDDEQWGRPPEENAGGVTATGGEAATDEWPTDDSEEVVFSLAAVSYDTKREAKMGRVGWNYQQSDLALDPRFKSLGQAQVFIIKAAQFFNNEERIEKMDRFWPGFLGEVGLLTDPLDQAHCLILTPTQFTNRDLAVWSFWSLDQVVWSFNSLDIISYSMGQPQVQFTIKEGVFQEEKGGKIRMDWFHNDMLLQALHAHLPTAEHRIRMLFNLPLESSVSNSLFDDQLLSPTLAINRLEEFPLATILLVVKDKSYLEVSYKNLMEFSSTLNNFQLRKDRDNGANGIYFETILIAFTTHPDYKGNYNKGPMKRNISIMEESPLVHQWALGGLKKDGWDPGGNKQEEKILKTATTYACHGNQTPQQQILFNFQLRFVDNYEGASISFMVPKNHAIKAMSSNSRKTWHGKFSNGFKYLSSLKSVILEDESSTLNVGVMLLELIIGGTTKKSNDVEAFEALLQASRAVDKEAVSSLMMELRNGTMRGMEIWARKVDYVVISFGQAQFFVIKAVQFCIENGVLKVITGGEKKLVGSEWAQNTGGSLSISCIASCSKLWDPGEPDSTSCIFGTSCFQLWDPGRRPLPMLLSRYLHLEDKVNFEGGSVDENEGNIGRKKLFGKVFTRKGRKGNSSSSGENLITNSAELA